MSWLWVSVPVVILSMAYLVWDYRDYYKDRGF